MTFRILGAALGAALALFVASPGFADESHTGTVVSIDANAGRFTIQSDNGERIEYSLRDGANIRMSDDRMARLNELREGQRVTVTSAEEGTGRMASEVRVLAVDVDTGTTDVDVDVDRDTGMGQADDDPSFRGEDERFPDRLPQTASPLPLLAAVGASSLATGAILRWRRRNGQR